MPEQQKSIGRQVGFIFSCIASAGMFVVLAVASGTSVQGFNEIFNQVMDWLSLSGSSFSLLLRLSPGIGHLLCYAILSFSLAGVFPRRNIWMAPILAGLFGALMELVQLYIPSRDASLMDIGINVLGISAGFGLYLFFVIYPRGDLKPRFN